MTTEIELAHAPAYSGQQPVTVKVNGETHTLTPGEVRTIEVSDRDS